MLYRALQIYKRKSKKYIFNIIIINERNSQTPAWQKKIAGPHFRFFNFENNFWTSFYTFVELDIAEYF